MDAAAVTSQIPYSAWQLALNAPGVVLGGIDELHQAVQIILSTPKGTDVHRPDFGSDVWLYLDQPQNTATPFLVRETWVALQRWEPRITLINTSITFDMEQVAIDVEWRPTDMSTPTQSTRVTLPAGH